MAPRHGGATRSLRHAHGRSGCAPPQRSSCSGAVENGHQFGEESAWPERKSNLTTTKVELEHDDVPDRDGGSRPTSRTRSQSTWSSDRPSSGDAAVQAAGSCSTGPSCISASTFSCRISRGGAASGCPVIRQDLSIPWHPGTLAHDWVREILSKSTAKIDRTGKLPISVEPRVGHAWLVNPIIRTPEVLRSTTAVGPSSGCSPTMPRSARSRSTRSSSIWLYSGRTSGSTIQPAFFASFTCPIEACRDRRTCYACLAQSHTRAHGQGDVTVKLSAFALSAVVAVAGLGLWTVPAHAEPCTNDIDCTANGTACGTDVCGYPQEACIPVDAGNPGWCTVSTDCKCAGIGATCVGVFCVGSDGGPLLAPPATSSPPVSAPDAGSGTTTQPPVDAGTGSAPPSTTPSTSSSSSSCAVSVVNSPTSPWPLAGLAVAGCLVAARRRKRR
jgi:hypothetical protein